MAALNVSLVMEFVRATALRDAGSQRCIGLIISLRIPERSLLLPGIHNGLERGRWRERERERETNRKRQTERERERESMDLPGISRSVDWHRVVE